MAKKDDNYSWLDKYSTDPRDLPFLDVTERHQDRQDRNTARDAHDRENDELNLSGPGLSGLYDDLVFDGSRVPPPPPSTPSAAPPPPPPAAARTAPPPPPTASRPLAPPAPQAPPAQRQAPPRRRPERLPSLTVAPLKPSPAVERLPEPQQLHPDGTSLFERLRKVPRSVFVPILFGGLLLISAFGDAIDSATSQNDPVPRPSRTAVSGLAVGNCFLEPPSPGVATVEIWPCNEFHGGEVIAFVNGPVDEALESCAGIAQDLAPSATASLPNDASVTLLLNAPDHRCVIISRSTGMIGSLLAPG